MHNMTKEQYLSNIFGKILIKDFLPILFNLLVRSSLLIVLSIAIESWKMIGPASIFSISLKIVIPASLSPFNKVYSIGDAPRHLGSSCFGDYNITIY